ncbi:MAG: aldehyde dehydrogenase family protein [Rhizobiales bacterium]|nr:aldehyde dehydrogenase family protein [Hyphomicrobiales bacterium]NRB15472.1 aldehyde dehydrogenase family protein [Hyphomicrobiales bacterium]
MSEVKRNLIAGQWAEFTKSKSNKNPADLTDIIGEYAVGSEQDVNAAVASAKNAFNAWATASPQVRHDLLDKVGNLMAARSQEIGTILAREEGKSLAEAVGETMRASQVFKFFAGEALRMTGDNIASIRPNINIDVTREPLGIVGIITPWNFPIAIPAWKIAPALAFGNCVIIKPADLTPACAHIIAELLVECGAPDGVFNLVMGRGSVVGEAMLNHPDIAAITFTGSVETGKHVALKCTETHKKFQLEMGGKNPMVILDDADLDLAVAACINGAFYSTGQRCTAPSRFIVQKGIHDAFVAKMKQEMTKLTIGNPLDSTVNIGPVVNEQQLKSNLAYIELAKQEADEVFGGEQINLDQQGYYQRPALFIGTTNDMRINQEEIFGPCASVIKVEDYDEALKVANDTGFGLAAGICTQSLKYATKFKRQSEAGMVMVNLPTAGVDYHVPFGGRKGSSYGAREQGQYAVEFFTIVKTAYTFAG